LLPKLDGKTRVASFYLTKVYIGRVITAFEDNHINYLAKLHYMDTGYRHVVQHHQRTSSEQFYNLYNKFATSQCQMLACGKLLSVGGEFVVQQVVELL